MKKIPLLASCLFLVSGASSFAANLMLDFGATAVADPYLTLSPGHNAGTIPGTETGWNTISTSATRTDLAFSDGTLASTLTLTLGQATGTAQTINFATPITSLALAGNGGGTNGVQSYLTAGSIYGDNTSSTAAGRDGFFGSGNGTNGTAIGMRIDGLTAGGYVFYVMARNTNSNASATAMNVYTTTGSSSTTFDFSTLAAATQANTPYASATYAGEYGTFVDGENYLAINVTVEDGESVFLAVDGGVASEQRGFLNLVQVVAIPEPSTSMAAALAVLLMSARRRRF